MEAMTNKIQTISVHELKAMMDEKQDFQLIDVRGEDEHGYCNIGGDVIPMNLIATNMEKINKEKKVIMYCRSGARSGRVVAALMNQHGFTNLFNLEGGILAWSEEIDPNVPQY